MYSCDMGILLYPLATLVLLCFPEHARFVSPGPSHMLFPLLEMLHSQLSGLHSWPSSWKQMHPPPATSIIHGSFFQSLLQKTVKLDSFHFLLTCFCAHPPGNCIFHKYRGRVWMFTIASLALLCKYFELIMNDTDCLGLLVRVYRWRRSLSDHLCFYQTSQGSFCG